MAILPGFPTSAIFTFHEFVAPVLRRLAGLGPETTGHDRRPHGDALQQRAWPDRVSAGEPGGRDRRRGLDGLPDRQGVGLGDDLQPGRRVRGDPPAAGVSRGGRAGDGDAAGRRPRAVRSRRDRVALHRARSDPRSIAGHAGPAGEDALGRIAGRSDGRRPGECDVAGVHLLDPETDTYNAPFLPPGVRLLRGYDRMQGLVYRPGDARFEGSTVARAAVARRSTDPDCLMVNRNRGKRYPRAHRRTAGGTPAGWFRRWRSGRTTPWRRPWHRGGPTGAWPLRRWPARMAWDLRPYGSSDTTSPSPRTGGTVRPWPPSATSSPTP